MFPVHADVKHLAHKIEVKEEKIKDWPHEGLVVYAEHSSYFYDMMTRPMLSQVKLNSLTIQSPA